MPMRCASLRRSWAGSTPRTRTVPLSGRRKPASVSTMLVLPAPFGPTSPKISPSFTVNDTPSTATVRPYTFRRPSTSMIAIGLSSSPNGSASRLETHYEDGSRGPPAGSTQQPHFRSAAAANSALGTADARINRSVDPDRFTAGLPARPGQVGAAELPDALGDGVGVVLVMLSCLLRSSARLNASASSCCAVPYAAKSPFFKAC